MQLASGAGILTVSPSAPPHPLCTHRYLGYGTFFVSMYLIYNTKPPEALDIKYWARPRAEKELQVRWLLGLSVT